MKFSEYINEVSFRFVQPDTDLTTLADLPALSASLSRLNVSLKELARGRGVGDRAYDEVPRRERVWLERINTILPADSGGIAAILSELSPVPRMSTVAIGAIINRAVSQMPDDCSFVNVGVWHGFSLLVGMRQNPHKRCVGVDNFSQWGGPRVDFWKRFEQYRSENHFFHEMDYRNYFETVHRGQIGVYFYDGDHSYDEQLKGLRLAEPYFADNCIVLVDDTNWEGPREATRSFVSHSPWRYDVLFDRATAGNFHPTWWNGLTILQRSLGAKVAQR
jgi:hypothetical protein